MAAQHTPGPWSVPHFAEPQVGCECGYVLTDGHMGAVCTVHASGTGTATETGDNPRFAQAVANARLIAAAPELLAASKRALAVLKATGESVRPGNALGTLEAAIAKATGEAL